MHFLKSSGNTFPMLQGPHPGCVSIWMCLLPAGTQTGNTDEHFSNNPAEYFSCCLASPAAAAGAHGEASSPALALQTAREIQILYEIALQSSIIQPEELRGQMGSQASHGHFKCKIVPCWTLSNTLIAFRCFNEEFRNLFGSFPIMYCNPQGSWSPP